MTKENEWLLDTVKELESLLHNENEPLAWEQFSPAEFDDIGDRLDSLLQCWKSKAESDPARQRSVLNKGSAPIRDSATQPT